MKNLIIEATKYSPKVKFLFEEKLLEISGESYPENTAEFYGPVISWLNNFFHLMDNQPITINFSIQYFNSSSSKVFMDFFDLLDEKAGQGANITVNWRFLEEDDNMLEYGEEFQEDISNLTFNLVPLKSL